MTDTNDTPSTTTPSEKARAFTDRVGKGNCFPPAEKLSASGRKELAAAVNAARNEGRDRRGRG